MSKSLYLTPDIEGIGGVLKRRHEDFYVEEVPLYEPVGEGGHTYVTVEKRGISTFEMVHRLGDYFGVSASAIGYAGLKDTRAVTRQRVSIEGVTVDRALDVSLPAIRIMDAAYHTNKLRLGHLAGNRFVIRVRHPRKDALERATEILGIIADRGGPNFFGMQRFSGRGNGHLIGRAMMLGDYDEALAYYIGRPKSNERPDVFEARTAYDDGDFDRARRLFPLPKFRNERRVLGGLLRGLSSEHAFGQVAPRMRRLLSSAYQSLLYNRVLARRMPDIGVLMDGDIAQKHRGGACFLVDSAETEQPRADDFEISPSGPLFGSKMLRPAGVPREIEDEIVRAEGVDPAQMPKVFHLMSGLRRPMRIPVMEPDIHQEEDRSIVVSFRLPSGSYATVILDEIMKRHSLRLFEPGEEPEPDTAGEVDEPDAESDS
ncbi:tRNA pseudouridine(13) synthase TruD [Candidatus Poribacteria bacterium]|nr:tRNA pseudouridine(13) synthase TruD [Candidatus Poribacteria bacterium]MBT5536860.1 tRNA pseudouridine(13) synthase TruD [Candidatus Poribacteria bacterium]MBT5713294.1 tRNA pseudouridine(13) synthase TruD [Candidatus Poribacteria bacterium]MBT7098578.1 tRNA pseudouridine(13) synthase TruD [Candidatus Poribacteria bacterium]MBT7804294.1 tRNA pseudouridine(13) synthase TruD [Candidatus Poribacteria bacterium]